MTAPDEDVRDLGERWPSGVGGMQCDACGQPRIVRPFPYAFHDDPLDEDTRWLCLPCYRGDDDDEF